MNHTTSCAGGVQSRVVIAPAVIGYIFRATSPTETEKDDFDVSLECEKRMALPGPSSGEAGKLGFQCGAHLGWHGYFALAKE